MSEVFVAPFPDGDRRWQVSNGGGRSPRWSRDELFFVAGPGAGPWQIMAARVATGSGSPVGAPVPLFTLGESLYQPVTFATGRAPLAPRYDVTPDGARFLMTRAQSGAGEARRWVIVQNWRSEF